MVANILNTIGRNKLVRFLNANVYKSLKLFISELLLDILKARSTANIPKIAVRIKIPKTVLLRFHFSISVEMIVIVFSSFLPPII